MLAERASCGVKMMARVLGAGRGGFYRRLKANPDGADPWAGLKEAVLSIWERGRGRFGFRRVHARLASGFPEFAGATRHRVGRRMSELGTRGICPNASKTTTVPDEDAPRRPDLVGRDFTGPVPTRKPVGDITCLRTASGFVCLATAVDLCARMVVGWAIADNMRTGLAVSAMETAWGRGHVAGNAIFHSDYAAESAHPQNLHIRSSRRNNAA